MRSAPETVYSLTAPAAPVTPALAGTHRCDVLVVGGGFTGLSTALHAAERGARVILLEAVEPGFGAAGRNGGQVNPGLKHEPDEIEAHFGATLGGRLVAMAGEGPGFLFDLVRRLHIACEARQGGTLRAAYHPASLPALDAQVAQWAKRGVTIERLDAAGAAQRTGTTRYVGATLDPRGGSVNPLAYARGLATAAQSAGAVIAGHSPATALRRLTDGWEVLTDAARILAPQVVLATDGYADALWPKLRRSFVPVYSSIVASAPLPDALRAKLLARGEVVYEAGHVTTYYRVDAQGRLLMGGRGVQRSMRREADHAHLRHYSEQLWPELRGVAWTHAWNGQFALTPDFYPRLHAPEKGLLIALGYSGRGVALATRFGAALADAVCGAGVQAMPLPVTPIHPLPLHGCWPLGVYAGVAIGRLRDRFGR
jgi:glycine/D-amino acid oxidase-like deaminating enzyme